MTRLANGMVFTGVGQPLQWRQFPVHSPVGSEILVRVTGCTLCGSDLHTYRGRRTAPTPSILGHEIIGRIEELGPDAPRQDAAGEPLRPGDRVTWSLIASCGSCFYCQRRLPQKCVAMVKYGHEPLRPGAELTGGLADYCRLAPGSTVLRLPDDLCDAVACPASCATATVAAALRAAGNLQGQTVFILGAGMLGLTACAMARTAGAVEVICCDIDPVRLTQAAAFGAGQVAQPVEVAAAVSGRTGGYGVDVALEMSGAPEAFEGALPLLRLGGTLVLVGSVFPSRPVPLLLEQVVRRHVTLRGVHNYAPQDLDQAVQFLSQARQYPFAELVCDWFPLGDADAAFSKASTSGVFRVGVRPSR
jgi:putative phosphonate catabolism associated alcohol dehydrogenase